MMFDSLLYQPSDLALAGCKNTNVSYTDPLDQCNF